MVMIYIIPRKLRIQEFRWEYIIFSSCHVMPKAINLPGNVVISIPPTNDFIFFSVFYTIWKTPILDERIDAIKLKKQ